MNDKKWHKYPFLYKESLIVKKWLSIMLILALFCAMLPAAFAEDGDALVDAPVEAEASDASYVGESGLTIEGEGQPSGDASAPAEAPAQPEPAGEEAYAFGYGRVIAETVSVSARPGEEAALARIARGDVVLAVGREGDDLKIAFNTERGIVAGWVPACEVNRLDDAEVGAFMAGIGGEAVALYEDNLDYPLPSLNCTFPEPEPAAEPAVEPVETAEESPEAAVMAPEDVPAVEEASAPAEEAAVMAPEDVPAAEEAPAPAEPAPEASDILLSAESISIGLYETYTGLTASLVPENAAGKITWRAGNSKVQIDPETGAIYGRKKGYAYVYATSENGIEKACLVGVYKAPTRVYVAPGSVTLAEGMQQQLTVAFKKGTQSGKVTYTSSDAAVAQVDETGLITAVGAGTATITAAAYNGRWNQCVVTVLGAPASVGFASGTLSIAAEQTETPAVFIRAADGSDTIAGLTFTVDPDSADPGCIAVDAATGAVTGVHRGEAKVIVTAHNGARSESPCVIRVVEAPGDMQLSAESLSIGLKETYTGLRATLIPKEGETECAAVVTWRSSNAKKVWVNPVTGEIYGRKTGYVYVYAKTHNGIERRCLVHVCKAPSRVYVSPASIVMSEGGMTCALKTAVTRKAASTITFISSDPSVASVDADGVVTSGVPGSATITVQTYNGRRAYCAVKVLAAPDQVFLPEKMTIARGMTSAVPASVVGAGGAESVSTYTFTAQNGTGSIAIDPATGEITGGEPGVAYVRVAAYNGVTTHLSGDSRVETVCEVTILEAPQSIELSATSAVLGIGQTLALSPVLRGPNGEDLTAIGYSVSSGNRKKAVVTQDGVVTGRKKGYVYVTVKAYNGVTASCLVRVVKAPTKVYIAPASPVIGVGQTSRVTVANNAGCGGRYTFTSSDPSVMTVDADGNITGVQTGTAVLTATAYNGRRRSVYVTVLPAPGYVTLNAEYDLDFDKLTDTYYTQYRKTLAPGQTYQITYENEYMTSGDVTAYESSNPAVATVTDTGLVTAVASGYATIVVRSTGGAETNCIITVTKPDGALPASLSFETGEITVRAGKSTLLPKLSGANTSAAELRGASYKSSDTSIASMSWAEEDDAWRVTGKRNGTAVITATVGDVTATLSVNVAGDAPTAISFDHDAVGLAVGENFLPAVRDEYGDAVAANLSSDAPGVVSVAENGALTALAAGEAVITASAGDLTAAMTVTVADKSAEYALDPAQLKLAVGERATVAVRAPENGVFAANVAYESDAPSVATVNAQGEVIARVAGEAHITASVNGRPLAGACTVTVSNAPSKLSLSPASIDAYTSAGGVQLTWAFGAPDEDGVVTFSSSDPDVAAVDEKGYVTFKAKGMAWITAVTSNGLRTSVKVLLTIEPEPSPQPNYRLFAAYNYCDSRVSGYLPFTKNNASSMAKVFAGSNIDGGRYSTRVIGNTSKKDILSGISSFFSGTTDDDVSIVYLCAHGHKTGTYSGYRMSLPGYSGVNSSANYYMTSSEIFNCVRRIKGKVILVLDSCYSGTFIEDMKDNLDREGGRISVLTAASDTTATYYKINDVNHAVDFFTFFLLQGIGYDEKAGQYTGTRAADTDGNGRVTLGEFYNYAARSIAANIRSYSKKSWFWGSKYQKTRWYAGGNADLVIYQP